MISVTAMEAASALTVGLAQLVAPAVATAGLTGRARFTLSNAMVFGSGLLSFVLAIRLHLKAMELDHALSLNPLLISAFDEVSLLAVVLINMGWALIAHSKARQYGRGDQTTWITVALAVYSIALLGLLRFGMGITQGKLSI